MHFSNTFDNIYRTETLRSLKLGYPSRQGLPSRIYNDIKSFSLYLRCSSPNNKVTGIAFGVFLRFLLNDSNNYCVIHAL